MPYEVNSESDAVGIISVRSTESSDVILVASVVPVVCGNDLLAE